MSQPVTPTPNPATATPPPAVPPADPGFPPPIPTQQEQGFSGLSIAGVILAVIIPVIGFVLSLIAITQTGKGKRRGRGLAVTGVVVSVVAMAVIGTLAYTLSKSTLIDPGCASGKAAIFKMAKNPTPETVVTAIDELNAASAEAKNDDVRSAMKTLADDYSKMMADAKAGKAPDAAATTKISADADAIDKLCTAGS